jgi:hypothetical protein
MFLAESRKYPGDKTGAHFDEQRWAKALISLGSEVSHVSINTFGERYDVGTEHTLQWVAVSQSWHPQSQKSGSWQTPLMFTLPNGQVKHLVEEHSAHQAVEES